MPPWINYTRVFFHMLHTFVSVILFSYELFSLLIPWFPHRWSPPLLGEFDLATVVASWCTEISLFTNQEIKLFSAPPGLTERIAVMDGTLGFLIEHTHEIVARWPALRF